MRRARAPAQEQRGPASYFGFVENRFSTGFQPRLHARALLTVGVGEVFSAAAPRSSCRGAIVRLQPGPKDEEGLVDSAERLLREWGAARVKRLPRLADDVVIVKGWNVADEIEADGELLIREVVHQIVHEVSVPSPSLLEAIVQDALDKAGA